MKKLYILLFTIFLLACNNKEQAQERPITPPNSNISVPKALQNYYKGFNFNKTGEEIKDISFKDNRIFVGNTEVFIYTIEN